MRSPKEKSGIAIFQDWLSYLTVLHASYRPFVRLNGLSRSWGADFWTALNMSLSRTQDINPNDGQICGMYKGMIRAALIERAYRTRQSISGHICNGYVKAGEFWYRHWPLYPPVSPSNTYSVRLCGVCTVNCGVCVVCATLPRDVHTTHVKTPRQEPVTWC